MFKERTVLDFEVNIDIWSIVEEWTRETGYREKKRGDNWRLYQKGLGMPFIPKRVEIKQVYNKVQIQAWVGSTVSMDIGRGFWALFPRRQARKQLNILLQRLGQPAI